MTFPIPEPTTQWFPQDGNGEVIQSGQAYLVDSNGNFLVDVSANFLVDGGVTFNPDPVTVWTESDGTQ